MSEETSYWLIILALIALIFWALMRDNKRMRNRTTEEYEADLARTKSSLVRAGLLQLDQLVRASKQKEAAVEYLKDEEQGQTKSGGKDDDAERTDKGYVN